MTENGSKGPGRRQFMRRAAMAAGGAIVAPNIITSAALGAAARAPAGERIVVGAIGIGGRGRSNLGAFMNMPDVQVVAVCDAHGGRREQSRSIVNARYGNRDCAAYVDARELLARPDIDAVSIATGDNNHALLSILAARAGKDIYCEKPMSVTIGESRAAADAMRRFARIYQCGTQRRNVGNFVFAANLARSGKLGKLTTLHAERAHWRPGVKFTVLPEEPQPGRDVMDWNVWLGVSPWRPYNATYHARGFWKDHGDWSGGSITEWGSHTVDLCQWANDSDDTTPKHYRVLNDALDVECVYENGVRLLIRSGLRFGTCPVRFEGEDGWIETGDNNTMEVHPKSLRTERRFSGRHFHGNHIREFLDCVKSRKQPICNADVAHHAITACHCANIAVRLGRAVEWAPAKEEFVGDEEANRLRRRASREPWRV